MEDSVERLAAIDVGSNAVRLVIGRIYGTGTGRFLKREAGYRVPVRLGADVFTTGVIPIAKANDLVETFKAFQHLLTLFAPARMRACATSAMREAGNGGMVVQRIRSETVVPLEIISGQHEAELLFANPLAGEGIDPSRSHLFIDVGGGSTELTLMEKAKPAASESFRIGAVRSLQGLVSDGEVDRLKSWIERWVVPAKPELAVGTGGNIGKIFDMAEHASMDQRISRKAVKEILAKLESLSYEERIRKLGLKPDRADVIIPAGRIYSLAMKCAGVKEMVVPKFGVSDGILQQLFRMGMVS
ncbi:MAG TPA: hypothetical protein VLM37_02025 [Fibrobacteraceae bacterium]|nr:hypothetical protein [Fibrobacteraceae bacterium]